MLTGPIPATGSPEHMKDDLAAGSGRLPNPRQRRQIRQLWEEGWASSPLAGAYPLIASVSFFASSSR